MIASFDPSVTHFGWVLFDEHKEGKEAVLGAGVFKTDPSAFLVQRLLTQQERVRVFLQANDIKFVTMEAPIWGDFNTEMLYALNQFVHKVLLDLKVFVLYIQSGTWKKHTFPGRPAEEITKHLSSHQAKVELDRQGRRFSEHIADAYHLGKIGKRFYLWHVLKELKDEDLTELEHDLFCGKHTYVRGIKKGQTRYYGLIYRENDQFFDYTRQTLDSHEIKKVVKKETTDGSGQRCFKRFRLL